jgi:hypothetical protein
LSNNSLTGARPGICTIVDRITAGRFVPNPAGTDPAQCPACLNTLTAPVTCTGANSVAPTAAPTAASSAVTVGASVATAALVFASLVALGP